jgi:DNA-binding IclR family transcriptional regulator
MTEHWDHQSPDHPTSAKPMASDYGVKSFQKIITILECFSTVDRSLSVSELAERSRLPHSTAHRLVVSLRQIGLLDQDGNRSEYRLGLKLFEFGNTVLVNMDIHNEARPCVEMLGHEAGEGVHLCVFDGWRMSFVDRAVGGRSGSNNSTIVMEVSPCHCTGVGKAALAFQPEATIERIIKLGLPAFTRNTITDPEALRNELAAIRERGYALDLGEVEATVRCVAAPIRNVSGKVIAAISVSGNAKRLSDERLRELAPLVIKHAGLISTRLGYNAAMASKITAKRRKDMGVPTVSDARTTRKPLKKAIRSRAAREITKEPNIRHSRESDLQRKR